MDSPLPGSYSRQGQIVLIVVLLTVLGLTVGLSLISRTVTDVRISSQIEQSGRAFSAAEAGIESALRVQSSTGTSVGNVQLGDSQAEYSVQQQGGTPEAIQFPVSPAGQSLSTWLMAHTDDGVLNESGYSYPPDSPLELCWSSAGSGNPAMIVSFIYKEGGEYRLAKESYDPDTGRGNNFLPADTGGGYCDGNYSFKKTIYPNTDLGISTSAQLILLRLTPVYVSASSAVKPTANLPVQGRIITSVGTTSTNVTRKIQVNQGYQILPSLLDFTLFSEN